MNRVFRSKLLCPSASGLLPRPRLQLGSRWTVLQAPAGAGKTALLAQWLPHAGMPFVYYRLDQQDRDGGVFAAHLSAGFRSIWPDWGEWGDPQGLAVELCGEAAERPPVLLALDGLESAFGEAWLADFLTILLMYAPDGLHLVVSTRAPLTVEVSGTRLHAVDLAFTQEEAGEWLGPGDWEGCWRATGGLPLALSLWKRDASGWRGALSAQMLSGLPPHVPPDIGRALVAEWLSGHLCLADFAHRVSVGQPGAEQLWSEIAEIHWLGADQPPLARERAGALWEAARARGDRPLMGATALLQGELCHGAGEYGQAMEWYRQAFDLDPMLELTGTHSMVFVLRDTGRLDDAEALALRCVEARKSRGDLVALAYAHLQYGAICMERGRLDEAESHLAAAEQLYVRFSANLPVGVTTYCHRALLEATRGNAPGFRRYAEEAYGLVRGRMRFLEALAGHVLAGALMIWGERAAAERLLGEAFTYLASVGAKWHLHVLLTLSARKAWAEGRQEEARRSFDQALAMAAREGYVQYLQAPRAAALPLIVDALGRGSEVALCQELLVRMGARAAPTLAEMLSSPEPQVRRAATYPLVAVGGSGTVEAIRRLLRDSDPAVREAALLAYQSLTRGEPAPVVETVRLSVGLLGPLSVAVEGRHVTKWRTTKARDLLAYLVLQGARPVTRDQVIEALWPDADSDAARSLLHTTMYNLRGTLGAVGDGLIAFAGGAYRLNRDGLEVDLERFERLTAAGDEASWQAAANLYRGELLEGLDYLWCEGPRSHARRLYVDMVRRLAGRAVEAHRLAEAAEHLQLLLQVDPLDEEAHLGLMQVYAAQGSRSAALQQYRTLVRLLDEELGLSPGARVEALYRQLLD